MKKTMLVVIILSIMFSSLWGEWVKKTFQDEFGDPTDDKFILHKMSGSFSNSAADNAAAYIDCLYRGDKIIEFRISEYKKEIKLFLMVLNFIHYI